MPGPATARHAPQSLSESAPARQSAHATERVSSRATERRLERPDNRRLTDDGRFSIDLNGVPKGYVMEWKRHSILGQEDTRNQVLIRQYHWEPVTHAQQPHIYGHLCADGDKHIVQDGMGLYMRPKYLNEEAVAETQWDTNHQLDQQLQALRLSSKDQVGDRNTYIKKQTVAVPQPVE
jgi:hypothetical protein